MFRGEVFSFSSFLFFWKIKIVKFLLFTEIEISDINFFFSSVLSWKLEYNNLNHIDIGGIKIYLYCESLMELHKDDSKNLITGEISMITSIHELCKKKNYIYVEQVMRPFDFNYINYFYYVEMNKFQNEDIS